MIHKVEIGLGAQKQLKKVPAHIFRKLFLWVGQVTDVGLETTKKVPGFHDEPLKGSRQNQRSIRLNKDYRAIYEIKKDGPFEFVEVQEVTKHEY